MEEQKNNSGSSGSGMGMGGMMKGKVCDCGCGCGWAHGHRIFRLILGLIILALVFGFGVKIGELKSRYGDFGGRDYYGRMRPMMMYNGAPLQMMNGVTVPGTTVAPTK